MILVTGATGHVGGEIVTQLAQRGVRVRAMTRNPDRVEFAPGVELVRGDFDDPASVDAACRGIEGVFLMTAQMPGRTEAPAHDILVARAACGAGVRRVVKLSVLGAGQTRVDPLLDWHRKAEAAVEQSGLDWTLLRPGRFMSNALQWADMIRREGKVVTPFADRRAASIDPADVAAVAVCALTESGHAGKAYPLSGLEVLTPRQEANIIAKALGRPLELVPLSNEAARQGMLRSGMSAAIVDSILAQIAADDSGFELLSTVAEITGRPPRPFQDWVFDHLDAFR
jgi:uncharacterized protein YbjT (DUF2867 family)